MRKRAGVILFCQKSNSILLLHRFKNGKEFWVIPGGHLWENESFEDAARREIDEELGIKVNEITDAFPFEDSFQSEQYFFSYFPEEIPLEIRGEEKLRSTEDNIYLPEWVKINQLQTLFILPVMMKPELLKFLDTI